jgi:hypothetical protein
MELDRAGGAATVPPKQERRGTQSRSSGRSVLVRCGCASHGAGDFRIDHEGVASAAADDRVQTVELIEEQ